MSIGTPTGKIEKLGGVDVYVAIPTGEYAKEKALLFLPGEVAQSLMGNHASVYRICVGLQQTLSACFSATHR
jgi:hypothetical protein